jgi:site-specific DNA-methyltransferase (adenine-specific)
VQNTILEPNKFLLIHGEALEEMAKMPDNYIDLLCVDLPYGITNNKWDCLIPLQPMWDQFNRVVKINGAMIFTAAQPFASLLITSNIANFKYDLIWEKTVASGQLNCGHQPLRVHESILVFYRKIPTYNEARTLGTPYQIHRPANYAEGSYNSQKPNTKVNDGYRHARSVIQISNPRTKGGHPTQKPVALMSYLIGVYSNPGDVVLDCCMGSGTTGQSCAELDRKFIGIELDERWFHAADERIRQAYQKNS